MSEALAENNPLTTQELLHRDLGRLSIVPKNGLGERNRFVKRYDWITHWLGETTLANKGLELQFNIISRMPEPLSSARSVYENAIQYWNESGLAINDLDQAVVNEGEHTPSPELVKGSFVTRRALASFALAHYQLDKSTWHPKRKSKLEMQPNRLNDARLLAVIQELVDVSDDRLYAAWFLARISESKRFQFWNRELVKVQKHPFVSEIHVENRAKKRFINAK